MLDENDKKEIGTIVNSAIDKLAADIILPGFAHVESRLDGVESRLDGVESRLTGVERKLTTMPDRDDLDRAVADVKGTFTARQKQQQTQVMLLISYLKEQNILKEHHVEELKKLNIFPLVEA